jgi:hypothetical protein
MEETYSGMERMSYDFEYSGPGEKKAIEMIGKAFKMLTPVLRRVVEPIRNYRNRPLAFWLDTLCIPLEMPYRALAISKMKEVYARATFTVVLDSELQAFNFRGCSDEELALRMGLSGWMRRAWTFQEGALASSWLRFLFKDGISPLPMWRKETLGGNGDYLYPGLYNHVTKLQGKVIDWSARRGGPAYWPTDKIPQSRMDEMTEDRKTFLFQRFAHENIKGFFSGFRIAWYTLTPQSSPADIVARMIGVWNSMRLRATSRESDKFICFAMACAAATAEREQLQKIITLPPDDRMRQWVMLQVALPSGLAFISGAKYTDENFCWLPRGVWPVPLDDDGVAVRDRTSNEFVFKKPGFVLNGDSTQLYPRRQFIISDSETALRYSVSLLEPPKMVRPNHLATKEQFASVAIILQARVGHQPPEYGLVKEAGVLLFKVNMAEQKIYGQFFSRVEVGLHIDESDDDTDSYLSAKLTGDDQAWIIR